MNLHTRNSVTLKNGEYGVVVGTRDFGATAIITETGSKIQLSEYDNDLRNIKDGSYDVMEIYRPISDKEERFPTNLIYKRIW